MANREELEEHKKNNQVVPLKTMLDIVGSFITSLFQSPFPLFLKFD
jgi:hypothetical protein